MYLPSFPGSTTPVSGSRINTKRLGEHARLSVDGACVVWDVAPTAPTEQAGRNARLVLLLSHRVRPGRWRGAMLDGATDGDEQGGSLCIWNRMTIKRLDIVGRRRHFLEQISQSFWALDGVPVPGDGRIGAIEFRHVLYS